MQNRNSENRKSNNLTCFKHKHYIKLKQTNIINTHTYTHTHTHTHTHINNKTKESKESKEPKSETLSQYYNFLELDFDRPSQSIYSQPIQNELVNFRTQRTRSEKVTIKQNLI